MVTGTGNKVKKVKGLRVSSKENYVAGKTGKDQVPPPVLSQAPALVIFLPFTVHSKDDPSEHPKPQLLSTLHSNDLHSHCASACPFGPWASVPTTAPPLNLPSVHSLSLPSSPTHCPTGTHHPVLCLLTRSVLSYSVSSVPTNCYLL